MSGLAILTSKATTATSTIEQPFEAAPERSTGKDEPPGAPPATSAGRGRFSRSAAIAGGALLVVSTPFLLASLSFVGQRWRLSGDWASIDYRVSQVGTQQTPLIGAYSTHGWAHPGPVVFWLASPLHWALGGDPRSLEWTAALVNIAAVTAITVIAWRRGRLALVVASLLAVGLLSHGLGPGRIIDIWNPLIPLFPLLLLLFLTWTAATGTKRAVIPALVLAALIAQAHVGLVPLVLVIAGWAAVWMASLRRHFPHHVGAGTEPVTERSETTQRSWSRAAAIGAALGALAWVPPLMDQLWGSGNLNNLWTYFTSPHQSRIGKVRALGLVSRYVRPDGPWLGGAEPKHFVSVVGSGAVPTLVLLTALGVVGTLAWRRRAADAFALCTLAATLIVGSVAIATRVEEPVFDYLVKWLEVVSAFSWFALVWSVWCLVEPRLSTRMIHAAGIAGAVGIGLAAVWSWPAAVRLDFPAPFEGRIVQQLNSQLADRLPRDRPFRVEHRGDSFGENGPGLIYAFIKDGLPVVTTDGWTGQKWGRDHIWRPGDRSVREVLTVAVHYPNSIRDSIVECERFKGARRIALVDRLSRSDRAWLSKTVLQRLFEPGTVNAAMKQRIARLEDHGFRAAVFAASDVCAPPP